MHEQNVIEILSTANLGGVQAATSALQGETSAIRGMEGAAGGVNAAMDKAGGGAQTFTSRLRSLGGELKNSILMGVGLGAGIGAFQILSNGIRDAIGYMKDAVRAAGEEETSQVQLKAALQANIPAWDGNTDAIQRRLNAGMALGFSDEEQRQVLGRLVAMTKDENAALAINATAMDVARATGRDLSSVAVMLGKAYEGAGNPLRRLGIIVEAGAKGMDVLGQVQARFAGQAQAFANSSVGAYESMQVQLDELSEDIGKQLMPVLTTLAIWVRDDVVPAFMAIVPVIGQVVGAIGTLLSPIGLIVQGIGWLVDELGGAQPVLGAAAIIIGGALTVAIWSAAGAIAAATTAALPWIAGIAAAIAIFAGLAAAVAAVSGVVNNFAMDFGDMGDRLHQIANDTGRSYDEVKDAIKKDMAETGDSFDVAAQKTEAFFENAKSGSGGMADYIGATFPGMRKQVEDLGQSARDLEQEWKDAFSDLPEDVQPLVQKAIDDAGATVKGAGAGFAATLKDGTVVFAATAEEMAQALPKAMEQAQRDAANTARQTPFEIAKAFREGEDATYQAALALSEQQHHAQDKALEVTKLKAELASDELRKQLNSKDPATHAAAVQHANQLKDQIYALSAILDPKAAEASSVLMNALNSADPQTRRYAQNLANLLPDYMAEQLPEVQALADEYGLSPKDALEKYRTQTATAASNTAAAVVRGLDSKRKESFNAGFTQGDNYETGVKNATKDAYSWGAYAANAWQNGVLAQISSAAAKARLNSALSGYTGPLRGESPPREGPLHAIDVWGKNVGMAYVDSAAAAIATFPDRLASVMGAVQTPALGSPALAGGMGQGAATAGGTQIGSINIYLPAGWEGSDRDVRNLSERLAAEIRMSSITPVAVGVPQ